MRMAKIIEIFESTQGEGVYLGEEQLFIRFFGCNIHCLHCDTRIYSFQEYSLGALVDEVKERGESHSICLTGGEPLLQADFIKDFLEEIKPLGFKIHLETNGILVDELRKALPFTDIIAMDFKLPSFTGLNTFWKEHEEFLKVALEKKVFVKMVIAKNVEIREIDSACDILLRAKGNIPVVLQPNWVESGEELLEKMIALKRRFIAAGIEDVKILPQAHKYSGIK